MLRHFPLKGTARVYTYVIPTASPFYVIPMTEGRRNLRTRFLTFVRNDVFRIALLAPP